MSDSEVASNAIATQMDDIRYIDVVYRKCGSFLLVAGRTEIVLYAIKDPNTGHPESVATLCLAKNIKQLRVFSSSLCNSIATVSYEDHSIDMLSFLEQSNTLELISIPFEHKMTSKIIDGWYVEDDNKMLIFSPNDNALVSYDIEEKTFTGVSKLSSFASELTYFQVIEKFSSCHFLACIETVAKKRSLIVIDTNENSIKPFEDPTFSLDIPESQPPYFHCVSIPAIATENGLEGLAVSILLSSCSPDLCILYFNKQTNSISVSIPSEDEDLATLPMLPNEKQSPLEDEYDTFCTGISVSYCCPWTFSFNSSNEVGEAKPKKHPFLFLLNSIGWIVGYSFLFPEGLSVPMIDTPLRTLPIHNMDSNEKLSSLPESPLEAKKPESIPEEIKETLREGQLNQRLGVKLAAKMSPDTFEIEPTTSGPVQSFGAENDRFGMESLDIPKDSSIHKILDPISHEIKDVLDLSSASLSLLKNSAIHSYEIGHNDLSSLTSSISEKISILNDGLKDVKPLILLVADLQQFKDLSIDELVRIKDNFSTTAPVEALVAQQYTTCSEKLSKLERKIEKLERKLQVLNPETTEPISLAWQHRIQQLEHQTESIERALDMLDVEVCSKLSLVEGKPSFSYGLSEEDCIVHLKNEKSPKAENITLWDHLLGQPKQKKMSNSCADKKPLACFLDPSFEKYENEAESSLALKEPFTSKELAQEFDANIMSLPTPELALPQHTLEIPSFGIMCPTSAFKLPTQILGDTKSSQSNLNCASSVSFNFPAGNSLAITTETPEPPKIAPLVSDLKKSSPIDDEKIEPAFDTKVAPAMDFQLKIDHQAATLSSFSFPALNLKPLFSISVASQEIAKQIVHSTPSIESRTIIEELPTSSLLEDKPNTHPNTLHIEEVKKIIELPDEGADKKLQGDTDKFDDSTKVEAIQTPAENTSLSNDKVPIVGIAEDAALKFGSITLESINDPLKNKPNPFDQMHASIFPKSSPISSVFTSALSSTSLPAESQKIEMQTSLNASAPISSSTFGASSFGAQSSFGNTTALGTSPFNNSSSSSSFPCFGATTFGTSSFGTSATASNPLNYGGSTSSASFSRTPVSSEGSQFAALASSQNSTIFSTDNSEITLAPFIPSHTINVAKEVQKNPSNKPSSGLFTKFRD